MTNQSKSSKFSAEVRERAVRMVFEHRTEHTSRWAALAAVVATNSAAEMATTRIMFRPPCSTRHKMRKQIGSSIKRADHSSRTPTVPVDKIPGDETEQDAHAEQRLRRHR